MKLLILYTSRSGATKQYAQWLNEEYPESDLINLEEFNISELKNYDLIVVGSPTYGGQIIATEFLKEHLEKLKDKDIYLMVVGAVPQNEKWSKKAYDQIPKNIRENLVGYVKLPGVSKAVTGPMKFIMKIFLGIDTENSSVQDTVLREDLKPVTEFVNGYYNKLVI